ncbi:overexpressed in colon carcinoma 1 protein homolog [Astyanax mexicanus]|uniref:overexpressed in colon carcinoma 1 protein homolog n=1 Tax=Astyanax mexicanus TaxID=7994 RepID=UPI0020CAE79F|nr:overexpressed in colon carcinoma 1 protein homolog [Astyanax mexicanus]
MGCGNSTATSTAGGRLEAARDETDDPLPEDEKRKNYGGVYVGLPADLCNVTAAQTPSMHKGLSCGASDEEVLRRDISMETTH